MSWYTRFSKILAKLTVIPHALTWQGLRDSLYNEHIHLFSLSLEWVRGRSGGWREEFGCRNALQREKKSKGPPIVIHYQFVLFKDKKLYLWNHPWYSSAYQDKIYQMRYDNSLRLRAERALQIILHVRSSNMTIGE